MRIIELAIIGSILCLSRASLSASEFPSCVGPDAKKTLAQIIECESKVRENQIRKYNENSGATTDGLNAMMDRLDTFQRDEVGGYLKANPDKATTDNKPDSSFKSKAEKLAEESALSSNAEKMAKDSSMRSKAESMGMTEASPEKLEALKKRLIKESSGGSKGVTPEMAQDIRDYLKEQQQGKVSQDMERLLNQLSGCGVQLTADCVNSLKSAAQAANAANLDLGVSDDVKDFLLQPPDTTERDIADINPD